MDVSGSESDDFTPVKKVIGPSPVLDAFLRSTLDNDKKARDQGYVGQNQASPSKTEGKSSTQEESSC